VLWAGDIYGRGAFLLTQLGLSSARPCRTGEGCLRRGKEVCLKHGREVDDIERQIVLQSLPDHIGIYIKVFLQGSDEVIHPFFGHVYDDIGVISRTEKTMNRTGDRTADIIGDSQSVKMSRQNINYLKRLRQFRRHQ